MAARGFGIRKSDENNSKKRQQIRGVCVIRQGRGAASGRSREPHTAEKAQLETDRDRSEPTARQGRGREGLIIAAL